jgi:hypothetical protein
MFRIVLFALLLPLLPAIGQDLRVGIIGTDVSHVIHFTRILNDPSDPDHIAGARVVAAYKGGSPDIASSRTRVEGYAEQLSKQGVEIVPRSGLGPYLCRPTTG